MPFPSVAGLRGFRCGQERTSAAEAGFLFLGFCGTSELVPFPSLWLPA